MQGKAPAEPFDIRPLTKIDADQALALYTELTIGPDCVDTDAFHRVLAHPGTIVMGSFVADDLVAMVTLHILPNVTWQGRPYALVENVVTTDRHRQQGWGRAVMNAVLDLAWEANCYKVMLMTGQGRSAKGFYTAIGFSSEDKFAMVMRRP